MTQLLHSSFGLFDQSTPTSTRGRPPKRKVIKQEIDEITNDQDLVSAGYQDHQNARPSVEILSCLSYQKFRYSGENRPGKKYQEKDFMELKLLNLDEKVVRVVIICTDAENKELIHPNGLVGKDCHDGIYDKEYTITKQSHIIKIPYLRTERIKTKKHELSKIRDILKSRAQHLPSPYRERCESQCTDQYTFNRKFDTTKVCLGVIVTVRNHFQGAFNGSLHAISHVVNNGSEKTALGILKLSSNVFSPDQGGDIDVFTTEDGPAIEDDKYFLYVSYEKDGETLWESEKHYPTKDDILYKRIIHYQVPPFDYDPESKESVEATLHLRCPQSNQRCECAIFYSIQDIMLYDTNLKRSFSEEPDDIRVPKRLKQNSGVKAVLKESLNRREDRRSLLPPAVEIVQQYDDGALVRRTDTHTVPDAIDHDVYSQNHSSNGHIGQKFVVCAKSDSSENDTVVIFTNDGAEDIQDEIITGMQLRNPINIDLSSKAIVVPDSTSTEKETHLSAKQLSGKISRFSQENNVIAKPDIRELQSASTSSPSISSKQNHETDSPWAVGSVDESDEALNIFNELSFNKQKKVENHRKKIDNSEKIVLDGGQKAITVLSDIGGTMSKVFNNKERENPSKTPYRVGDEELDFSKVQLPSTMNLNTEFIANLDIVKDC